MFAQILNEELFLPIHQRIIDGGAAKIYASHHFHSFVLESRSTPLSLSEFVAVWPGMTGL